ncbi:MAG: arylsulfatase [Thermoguttaceae bacterium]|nr:arylsulfatase [Thermoguttaceae bacterium]
MTITRRTALSLLAALVFAGAIAGAAEPRVRPNVLLILTDDQGYGDFSIHGNPHVRTPHLDRLGESSVRFDRFYVNSFCAPTRAALLTGRWPLRTGVHGVTHNREAMRPNEVTIAEALRGGGYRTALIGKWHNGEQYPYTPPGQGFDEFFGFHNGHWNDYFDATLLRGTQVEKTQGYISDVLTDEAMKWIAKGGARPFFCYLAYNAPHSPFQVPDKYFDRFKVQGFDDAVAAFWGMCENLDENIGRLLAHLDRLELAENTIVVFLTDNGGTAGVKIYNAGMRGGKTSVHEGGTRVPLFVRWPAAQWTAHVVKPIVSHIDLYPTPLDLCGVPAPPGPPLDGISLRPLLEGDGSQWPERVLFTHNPIDETNKFPGAVRTDRYRLVCDIRGRSGGSGAVNNDASATGWQLYDMTNDPGEKNDLARQQPEKVAELSALYDAWFADISRDGLRRFPIPVGYAEENPVEIHAPQAYFTAPLRFHSGPGYANDWLTDWTDANARVWFDLDVVRSGRYALEIAYACPAEDAGAKIRIRAGDSFLQATVPVAPVESIPLPHRDQAGHEKYQNRHWATLKLGSMNLPKGPVELSIETISKPGSAVMDFKHIRLELQESQP